MTADTSYYVAVLVLSLGALAASTRLSTTSRQRSNDPRRLVALAIALLTGWIVLFSPLDELSDRFFSAHMVEHELLLYTTPIALLIALPMPLAIIVPWRLLPSRWRRSVGRSWNWTRDVTVGISYLERPVAAFVLSTLTLWIWHAPALYDLALRSEWAHTIEHVCFLVTALLYWRPLLSVSHRGVLNSNAKRALYLVAGGMQGGLLGALIALDPTVLYVGYLSTPKDLLASTLADQHRGGTIMWFTGPVFCSFVASLVMVPSETPYDPQGCRRPELIAEQEKTMHVSPLLPPKTRVRSHARPN